MSHIYYLIMAGGEGTRFQPLSTPARPKQFINIVGTKSLIRQTFERIEKTCDVSRIYVATNVRYVDLVRHEMPEIALTNIIGETAKKNTAPCIGFAARLIAMRDPEAVMICLPSDHVILDGDKFRSALGMAALVAMKYKMLVTLGITPTTPSTDYGYIERSGSVVTDNGHAVYCVKRFVEKPKEGVAKQYVASGQYYWNSGIFAWTAPTILNEISLHLPELGSELDRLPPETGISSVVDFFEKALSISIDYGVMEKSGNVAVIPSDFGWSDVGTWKSLKELADGGVVEIAPDVRRIMEAQLR